MSNSVRVSPNIQLLNDNENSIMDYLRSKKVSPCPVETRAPTFAELKNRRGDGEPGKYLSRSGKFSSSPQRELMSRGLSIKSAVVSMRHAAGIEDQSTKSSRINNDSFTAVYKHGHIGKFPWLYAPEVFSEYRIYQKSYFDIYSCIPQTAFFFAFLLTRCNMFTLTEGPYFQTSLSLFFVYILLNLFFYFVNGALFFASNSRSYLFRTARRLQKTWLGKNADDLLCLVGTILMSFVLLARVMKGECDKDLGTLTILDSSKCNSLGKFRQIPQGQVMAIYLVPIISQICLKGVTLQMNLCCWALGTAFIVAAVILVDGWKNEFWSILFSLLFLLVSFETERHYRIIFLESKRAAAAEAERGELFLQNNLHEISNERKRHDVLLVANAAEDEKRLMDREREQLTSLIGNVAHDLKTPLQSIRMDLELLKTTVIALVPSLVHKKEIVDYKSDTDDDTPLSIISSLNAACDFMSMAINRSIDFAKTSGGIALIPAMETFNINSALSVPVNVIKHLQSAIKIVVNPYPAGMCLNVISDKHWFTENILCLLSNAVKYSDGGTVDVIVELLEKFVNDDQTLSSNTKTEASKHGLFVRVSIEDNGIGLSKDDRENLFQPFKQAQRLAGGTGLGLYSLSKRVEALNGHRGVDARKDEKRGSAFWFAFPYRPDGSCDPEMYEEESGKGSIFPSLRKRNYSMRDSGRSLGHPAVMLDPQKPAHVSDPPDLTSEELLSANSQENRKCHILLVDDSLTILKVCGRSIRQKGYKVTTACNGSAGLDLLVKHFENKAYDLVLMDLQMPVMDGIETVKRFREFEKLNNIEKSLIQTKDPSDFKERRVPIIGMSANSDAATKQCALDAGMDLFIAKPFTIQELQPLIDKVFDL